MCQSPRARHRGCQKEFGMAVTPGSSESSMGREDAQRSLLHMAGGGSSHWGLIAAGHPEVPLQSPEVEIREALVISHLKDVG